MSAGAKLRMMTAAEVRQHNRREDCYVIVFSKVIDLTPLVSSDQFGVLVDPLLDNAGEDVSHWFDKATGDIRTFIDPETGLRVPYTPHGRFIHVPPRDPVSTWRTDFGLPWWKDPARVVAQLSDQTRRVWVVNTLSGDRHLVDVGVDETLRAVRDRFLDYNAHAKSYTWKGLRGDAGEFVPLDMNKTLGENGIDDDEDEILRLGMNPDDFLPTLHLYFNDDLTEA